MSKANQNIPKRRGGLIGCLARLVSGLISGDYPEVPEIKEEWSEEDENEFWRKEMVKTRFGSEYSSYSFGVAGKRYVKDCLEKGLEYQPPRFHR